MISIELGDVPSQNMVLEPEKRSMKGSNMIPTPLLQQVSLGGPEILLINEARAEHDETLRYLLEENAEHFNFYLIHLSCSFSPNEGELFERARIWISLKRTDDKTSPKPIAWSMQPSRLTKTVRHSSTVEFDSSLKFLGGIVGLGASKGKDTVWDKEEPFLEAFKELSSDPLWQFKRTKSVEISGSHRLVLVAKVPNETQTKGTIKLNADVKRKKWGLLSYQTPLEQTPMLSFQLAQKPPGF